MTDPDERSPYLNRELSWLEFNARVLALAEDPATPLLERLKFLAIFSQNLDEFFQVRVAGLKDRVAAGVTRRSPDGMSASEQLEAINRRSAELVAHADEIFLGPICRNLADRMGGTITLANRDDGPGAVAELTLPRVADDEEGQP